MPFTPTSGFTGTATIGSGPTELPVVGWGVTPTATILRYFNSLTGKHPAKAATFSDLDFFIDIDWDDSNQPFSTSPLGIVPSTALTAVKLRLDGPSGSKYWDIGNAIVVGTPQTLQRDGKIVTRLNCTASGATWTAPGGTAF